MLKSFLWDEENRLLAVNNNGSVSCYFYDAAGERTVKLTSETEMVHVNGKKVGGNANICKFTAYVSPYFVVSNGGAYTKTSMQQTRELHLSLAILTVLEQIREELKWLEARSIQISNQIQ